MDYRRFVLETALSVALAVLASASQADTIYVDDDNCPGPGSGTEADPYCSIQTAIDNAVDTDEIVVAPGTYYETIDLLGKAITLGSSDGPGLTVLDGTGIDDAVVKCSNSEGPDTVVRGFTITGGSGFAAAGSMEPRGGGLYVESASPTVIDCVFTRNAAFKGGALYGNESDLTTVNCVFIANTAGHGGAIRLGYGEPVFNGCAIIGNTADFHGGGISIGPTDTTMTDCILSGNSATVGGAISMASRAVRLNRCRLIGNSADIHGGAVYDSATLDFEMVDCDVSYNSAAAGGGLSIIGNRTKVVSNCTLVGNLGHGVVVGHPSWYLKIDNSILWGNTPAQIHGELSSQVRYSDVQGGWSGPGSNNIDADPQFVEDLAGSWTSDPIYDEATDLTVLTDGNATFVPGGLVGQRIIPDTSLDVLKSVVLSNTETTITVIGSVWSGFVSEGDVYLIRDDHLSPVSPCIDAGHNWAIAGLADTDLDRNPRFADDPVTADTGCGVPVIADIGAYEYPGDPSLVRLGDIDGNGGVSVNDFLLLLAAWGPCLDDCCLADLNRNGHVQVNDFLILLANWGP